MGADLKEVKNAKIIMNMLAVMDIGCQLETTVKVAIKWAGVARIIKEFGAMAAIGKKPIIGA